MTAAHNRAVGAFAPEVEELAAALAAHLPAPAPSDALLDAAGAARLLNVPKSWVESQARQERIPCRRLGHYVRFDRDDLLAWSEGRSVGPRPRGTGAAPVPRGREAA